MKISSPEDTDTKSGRWTASEQRKFERALRLYGRNWKKISEMITTRTATQCRSHAQKFFMSQARMEILSSTMSTFVKKERDCRDAQTQYGDGVTFFREEIDQ